MARREHTWEGQGPLGLTIKQLGEDRKDPAGVRVSGVAKDRDLPEWLIEGLVISKVAGEGMADKSYEEVVAKITRGLVDQGAGRPLTLEFETPQVCHACIILLVVSGQQMF